MFKLSSGQIVSFLINTISIPILARIYPKDYFGYFAIYLSTTTLVSTFLGFGLGSAIMVPPSISESKEILNTTLILGFLTSFVLFVLSIIFRPFDSYLIIIPFSNIELSFLIFFSVNIVVLNSLLSVYNNKLRRDSHLMLNPIIGSIATFLCAIILGAFSYFSIGMIFSYILSNLLMLLHQIRKIDYKITLPKVNNIIDIVKKYKKFIVFQYPANLIYTLGNQLPNQFIASAYSPTMLSDYSMTQRVIGTPANLISLPIQKVYFRTMSEKLAKSQDIALYTFNIFRYSIFLGSIPVILVMAFGKELFGIVLGQQWASSGDLASIFMLSFFFNFIYSTITYARVLLNKQKLNLFFSIFQTISILLSLIIPWAIGKEVEVIFVSFAIASTAVSLLNIYITFIAIGKYSFRVLIYSILLVISAVIAYLVI